MMKITGRARKRVSSFLKSGSARTFTKPHTIRLLHFPCCLHFFFFLHCGSPTLCVHFIAEVVRSLTLCVQLDFRRKAFFQFASQAVEQVQLTLNPKSICLWVARGGFTAHPRTSTLVKSRKGGWRYANSKRP